MIGTMRKLVSILLLAACLLAAPPQAYAADSVDLGDTPPMEEDAAPTTQGTGEDDAPSPRAASTSPRTGDEHSTALWACSLLLASVGLTSAYTLRKRESE